MKMGSHDEPIARDDALAWISAYVIRPIEVPAPGGRRGSGSSSFQRQKVNRSRAGPDLPAPGRDYTTQSLTASPRLVSGSRTGMNSWAM